MMAAAEYYIFTGREAVPLDVKRFRIDESLTVIPVEAFRGHPKRSKKSIAILVSKKLR